MTALRLADLYMNQEDVERACLWWVVANHGGDVGVLPELGLHEVRWALEVKYGEAISRILAKQLTSGVRASDLLVSQGLQFGS